MRIAGLEFRQKIHLSNGQADYQNHLSELKSTCPAPKKNKKNNSKLLLKCHALIIGLMLCCSILSPIHRPLSRRLDRCDRVIQDESGDSNGGNV